MASGCDRAAVVASEGEDEVRETYNQAQHVRTRQRMMQAWADYLDELRAENTTAVRINLRCYLTCCIYRLSDYSTIAGCAT
jgi:predicted secreted protein